MQGSSNPAPPPLKQFSPTDFANAQIATVRAYGDMLPGLAQNLGAVNRQQGTLDLKQYVDFIRDPGMALYGASIQNFENENKGTRAKIDDLQAILSSKPKAKKVQFTNDKGEKVKITRAEAERKIQGWQSDISRNETEIGKARASGKDFDLNAEYTKAFPEITRAQDAFKAQLGAAATPTSQYQAAQNYFDEATTTGTQRILEDQAARELALGRSLTPEQEREATQAARAGMAARGLGVGSAAAAAEILNRDRYATERESQRRDFANAVMRQGIGIRQDSATLAENERLRQLGLGETLVNTTTAYDPRMRLLGVAQPNNQIGGLAMNSALGAGQVGASGYTFGINQNNSLYNTWQTNRTAERVGMMNMIGSTIQGIASGAGQAAGAKCWIARAAWGEENPRWVEFRDSMLTHAPEWFIRFYCRFGPAIARHIHTPARRAIARLILATLQHLWTPANPKLQPA